MEFQAWPKIPRHTGVAVTITEKIDGTNACLVIEGGKLVGCQSRTRIIDRHNDNFGFANWAYDNENALVELLGEGRHFGEWAGPGIQKNPLNLLEKTFFLFNSYRWFMKLNVHNQNNGLPVCSVPVLYTGNWRDGLVEEMMNYLADGRGELGQKPEGIILYWHTTRSYEKYTFEHQEGKWRSVEAQ